jgi:hypothetical protein
MRKDELEKTRWMGWILVLVSIIVVGAKLVTAILETIWAAFVVVLHLLGYYP